MQGVSNVEQRLQIVGWLTFLICSGFFITQSLLARDPLGLAASLMFLLGCLFFLAPFVFPGRSQDKGR